MFDITCVLVSSLFCDMQYSRVGRENLSLTKGKQPHGNYRGITLVDLLNLHPPFRGNMVPLEQRYELSELVWNNIINLPNLKYSPVRPTFRFEAGLAFEARPTTSLDRD